MQEKRLTDADKGQVMTAYRMPDIAGYVLLPGDPQRVSLMASQWEGSKEYEFSRGFRGAVGTYKGEAISAVSTGMGGPSTEDVIVGTAEQGAHTLIRIGTTGSLSEEIRIGDIIINDASVRMDGTSNMYVCPEYPAAASYEVTLALIQAAERLGVRDHVGTGYTAGSFFTGQQRPSFGGYRRVRMEEEMQDLISAKVINEEMEAAALFTLSRIFGLRSGMCACVVAERLTGRYAHDAEGIANACLIGAEAVSILTEWDRKKQAAGKKYYYPEIEEQQNDDRSGRTL